MISENTVEQKVSEDKCTGCAACMNVCPTLAISMKENDETFIMPTVDRSLCISCGKCVEVCPALHVSHANNPNPECYAYRANDEVRAHSSSGGLFTLLAKKTLESGGSVCGAAFDFDFAVKHVLAGTWENVAPMRGSKYVQSASEFIYKKTRIFLDTGGRVLFTGTPCQVAALNAYLGKPYPNLLTIDLMCHGVPSQLVFKRYLAEISNGRVIKYINFRDKRHGWVCHILRIEFTNGDTYVGEAPSDMYEMGFRRLLILRKSCSNCPFSAFPRQGDITMGDFWQYEKYLPDNLDSRGTSLVFVNSDKGAAAFASVKNEAVFAKKLDCDVRKLPNRVHPVDPANKARDRFFELLKYKTVADAVRYSLQDKFDIGLLGWYKNWNLGSSLNMLALYKTLTDMGYAVLMITPPETPHSAYKGMQRFYDVVPYPPHALAPIKPDKDSMRPFNEQCDIFLTGSDQMFNIYCYRDVKGYVSQDWVQDSKRKIAYAVSFGHDRIFGTENERAEMAYFMQKFDAFSVREDSGIKICAEQYGVEAEQVLDPCFLCPPEFYKAIADTSTDHQLPAKKYLYAYILGGSPEKEKIIEDICNKFELPYILYGDWNLQGEYHLNVSQSKLDKKLYDLINSDFIVTDSYHGAVLSIILKKNFVCYANVARGYTRFESLLGKLGLMDRIVMNYNEYECRKDELCNPVDYDAVYEKLLPLIESSRKWIKNQIVYPLRKAKSEYDMAYALISNVSRDLAERFNTYIKEVEEKFTLQLMELQKKVANDTGDGQRI